MVFKVFFKRDLFPKIIVGPFGRGVLALFPICLPIERIPPGFISKGYKEGKFKEVCRGGQRLF